jgi:hypothetical protein
MATKTQILSREMILPGYKGAISPGPPTPPQLPSTPHHSPFTIYELPFNQIMQNKPNLLDAQMNVNSVIKMTNNNEPPTMDYSKQTQTNPILQSCLPPTPRRWFHSSGD